MVQFKGINVSVVSQLGAQRLPEHSTARAFDSLGTVAACYVPVYSGAQIWLEYSIDGPHPPQAAYFFKMSMNGQVASSWDCTAKHDYHGKTVYLLQTVRSNVPSQHIILQKSMVFASIDGSRSPGVKDDCIEVKVHRIQHRRRIRELPLDTVSLKYSQGRTALKIVANGLIEQGRPARRYQYQIIDPQDEPYATFRFYCRTQDYLQRHQILTADRSLSSISLATSNTNYFDTDTSPKPRARTENPQKKDPSTPTKLILRQHYVETAISPLRVSSKSPIKVYSPGSEKISSVRDSIEDLPSAVPRSPQSPRRAHAQREQDIPPSPTRLSSPLLPEALTIRKNRNQSNHTCIPTPDFNHHLPPPPFNVPISSDKSTSRSSTRHRHKPPYLTLTLDTGPPFTPDNILLLRHQRPLSPFTPGGLLRRLSSAPALHSGRSTTPSTSAPALPAPDASNNTTRQVTGGATTVKSEIEATKGTTKQVWGGVLLNSLLGRK